jgi:hypothetical protein
MMTETGKLILKLTVLIVPSIIVLFTLYGGPKGGGIGGGGYDLSELVYSGLLTVFIFGWNIWVLVALSTAKTPAARLSNQILLGIGIAALIVAAVWFFKQVR